MMKAAGCSEILVPMNWTTWCHIAEQEDRSLNPAVPLPVTLHDVFNTERQVQMVAI